MKNALTFAAVAKAATGLALLIVPSLVGELLLGQQLTGVAVPVARVAGIALFALGIASWPGPPLVGMSTAHWSRFIWPISVSQVVRLAFSCGRPSPFMWS